MIMVYLLWIVVVGGGFFLGIGAIQAQVQRGFDLPLTLMAVLYNGCALYGLPKLVKLVLGRSA